MVFFVQANDWDVYTKCPWWFTCPQRSSCHINFYPVYTYKNWKQKGVDQWLQAKLCCYWYVYDCIFSVQFNFKAFCVVFNCIEQYAPGFKDSIVGTDVLTPRDLEDIFCLTGGVSVIVLKLLYSGIFIVFIIFS